MCECVNEEELTRCHKLVLCVPINEPAAGDEASEVSSGSGVARARRLVRFGDLTRNGLSAGGDAFLSFSKIPSKFTTSTS